MVSSGVSVVRSVRAKLLVLLALLSLPLLIVSLIQLKNYRETLSQQEARLAQTKLSATSAILDSWLRNNSSQQLNTTDTSVQRLQQDLRALLQPDFGTAIAIYDDRGQALGGALTQSPTLDKPNFTSILENRTWKDQVTRATIAQHLPESKWGVAIGLSSAQTFSPGGGQILMVTATWAFALVASTLIAVWAAGRYTNPVRTLAASVSTFGEGNLQGARRGGNGGRSWDSGPRLQRDGWAARIAF
ncbi:MAG: hypothetical protein WKF84_13715 [Pyrinomonadaceae bacterium]